MKKYRLLFKLRISLPTACVLMCLVSILSVAHASPWLLKPGQLVVSTGYDQSFAQNEFLDSDNTKEVPFSLQGLLTTSTLSIGASAGWLWVAANKSGTTVTRNA